MITRTKKPLVVLMFQLLFTFLVILCISFLSTIIDGDWRNYLPWKASGVVLATLVICLLIGLPIRLNTKINTWWTDHQLVSLIGMIVGALLLSLSCLPGFREVTTYYDIVTAKSNSFLSITGWFLTAFFLVHWYPKPVTRQR